MKKTRNISRVTYGRAWKENKIDYKTYLLNSHSACSTTTRSAFLQRKFTCGSNVLYIKYYANYILSLHGKKRRARCSTGLNNVLLPTLFTLVNNIEQCCWAWIGGNNIRFNIVDSYEQCGQQSIVQSCFHQYCNNLIVFCRVDYFIFTTNICDIIF
jgi:hypothetical protein